MKKSIVLVIAGALVSLTVPPSYAKHGRDDGYSSSDSGRSGSSGSSGS